MAQCQGKTKAGNQCKAQALEGEEFCRFHLPTSEEPVTTTEPTSGEYRYMPYEPPEGVPEFTSPRVVPAAEAPAVGPAEDTTVRVRYLGRASYSIGPYHFSANKNQEQEVPVETARHLLASRKFKEV